MMDKVNLPPEASHTGKRGKRLFAARALFVALSLGAWFGTQSLIAAHGAPAMGIGDQLHIWTAPIHDALLQNHAAASALLVASSAFIDALGLFLLGRAIFGDSLRPLVALLIVFGLRQICQLTCALPLPDHMIWFDPGVPSLLVTYGIANDLFFSGHTSIAILGAIELGRLGRGWMVAGILIAIFEAVTVIVLRAHYTMDVITAFFAALFAVVLADKIAPHIDIALSRLLRR